MIVNELAIKAGLNVAEGIVKNSLKNNIHFLLKGLTGQKMVREYILLLQ